MNITKKHLKQLINEEFKRRLDEKRRTREDRRGPPGEFPREKKFECGDALNIIDKIAEDLDDSEKEEVRWLLTKVGEKFGLEPKEDEDE